LQLSKKDALPIKNLKQTGNPGTQYNAVAKVRTTTKLKRSVYLSDGNQQNCAWIPLNSNSEYWQHDMTVRFNPNSSICATQMGALVVELHKPIPLATNLNAE